MNGPLRTVAVAALLPLAPANALNETKITVGEGERIEITHRSPSFKCFAKGVVDCAEYLVKQPKGAYTVQDAFGLN